MKIGTIGTNMISGVFADAVKLNEGTECIAAYSRAEESGRAFTSRHEIKYLYTSLEEMLQNDEIEFIYVGSPNSLHYEQVMMALEYGKHVICEKPFASNTKEAKKMIRMAREKELFLFEAVTTIHSPNYHLLQEKITAIGQVKMIQCKYVKYSSRYDELKSGKLPNIFNLSYSGGALMDLNVYNIHFVTKLFGYPEKVTYAASKYENGIDLEGVAVLRYPHMLCTCTAAKDIDGKNDIQIHGEHGYIYMPGGPNGKRAFTIVTGEGEACFDTGENENPLYCEVKAFHDMYKKQDLKKCYQLLEHTERVMEVLDEARRDAGISFPADSQE